jgi:hypothetical protein
MTTNWHGGTLAGIRAFLGAVNKEFQNHAERTCCTEAGFASERTFLEHIRRRRMTRAGSLARVPLAAAGPVIVEVGIMKSLRIVALAAFVVLSTAVAVADPIDPVIRSGGGTGSDPITSLVFTILTKSGMSPTDGSPCILIQGGISTSAPGCIFRNDITTPPGDTINQLVVIASHTYSGSLTCLLSTALGGPSSFTECAPSGPVVRFFGGPGIPFGGDFSFGFRGFNANAVFKVIANGGSGGFVRNTLVTNTPVTSTPEPGTLVLFVGGIGALLVRRRARAR